MILFACLAFALPAQTQPDIQVDVDLVTVACSVETSRGAPAANLSVRDFRILDDGQPRQIRNLWRESDLPLTIALVADISGSQAGYIRGHREVLSQFLNQVIGSRDRAMIVTVAKTTRLVSPLTASLPALSAAVGSIGSKAGSTAPELGPPCRNPGIPHSCGGTALWHAMYFTAGQLKPITGRKAIVVLSDGIDTGSDISLSNVIEAAQASGIVVYSIKYASPMRFLSITGAIAQAVSRGLGRISRETGGVLFPDPGRDPSAVFTKIETDLRNLYVLSFTPPAGQSPGFHKLTVTTTQPGLVVRSRSGFVAAPR